MWLLIATHAALVGLAAALVACAMGGDVGYVELKTVPASTSILPPVFYLDNHKLDPLRKGVAVLQQRVGTVRLAIDGPGGHLAPLCSLEVRKNRITSVTVSVLERPPRCQCRNGSKDPGSRTCVS